MQSVTLVRDPLGPVENYETAVVEDVRDFLMEKFDAWPSSARIYHGVPAMDRDVTPSTERDVERLLEFDELTVVVFPADPITIIIAVVAVIVGVAASLLLMPKIPSMENTQHSSPNNGLSDRQNRARVNGRVPDIFGQVRSVPDMLAVPYRVYDTHRELEIAYMCIGRGEYDISDLRDGDTLINDINLASAAVYGPYSSPNDGSPPQLLIGPAIGDPVFSVTKLNEVNGQTMLAPNNNALVATADLQFVDGGIIRSASGGIDFTDYFHAGDLVDVDRAHDVGGDPGTDGKQASAVAHSAGFDFASYDPTVDFTAGKWVSIISAVYQIDDGGTSGGIVGGTDYPDPTYDPYCIDWNEMVLLANAAHDGEGEQRRLKDCVEGDWVWTRHHASYEWGAYPITALDFVDRTVLAAELDAPLATLGHRFGSGLDADEWSGGWIRMQQLGKAVGIATVGLMTVPGAMTYVSVRPSGRRIINHNLKNRSFVDSL